MTRMRGGGMTTPEVVEFFLSHISETDTGCWIWDHWKNNGGYPTLKAESGKATGVHRWALQTLGSGLRPGHHASHVCNTRLCVRPHRDHLISESPSDNMNRQLRTKIHRPCGRPYDYVRLNTDGSFRQKVCSYCKYGPDGVVKIKSWMEMSVYLDHAAAR